MGSPDLGGYIKFTPKYIIVGVSRGVSIFLKRAILFFLLPHGNFQNPRTTPSGRKVHFIPNIREKDSPTSKNKIFGKTKFGDPP
jgi:hypothetical protein